MDNRSSLLGAVLREPLARAQRSLGGSALALLVFDEGGDSDVCMIVAGDGSDLGRLGDLGRIAATTATAVRSSGAEIVPVPCGTEACAALVACGVPEGARVTSALEAVAAMAGVAISQTVAAWRGAGAAQAGVEALAWLIELRDNYTGRHSDDVVEMARLVGRRLGMRGGEQAELEIAARLHDIGKIGVPDSILLKPGPLSEAERDVVRCHAEWGAETLERLPGMERVARAVRHHHEHWDGRGYPDGLAGEAIPLTSRVIAVCDAFAAMTSMRPYRRALAAGEARRLLEIGSGAQFDPDAVAALCAALDDAELQPVEWVIEGPVQVGATGKPTRVAPAAPSTDLSRAFDRLDALPAAEEARTRLLRLLRETPVNTASVVTAVESDVALTIAALRAASAARAGTKGGVLDVGQAVEMLAPELLARAVADLNTFDFFEPVAGWGIPEHFRLHAVATHRAAQLILKRMGRSDPGACLSAALLHDVGKLVLAQAFGDYPAAAHGAARTPEQRVWAEQRTLGIDHALVGALLLRRWGLPPSIALAVERHHVAGDGDAAVVRLADLLVHYLSGDALRPRELERAGRTLGFDGQAVRALMFELPLSRGVPRRRGPSPLSEQETRALRALASGKVYKEIALELGLSPSTVRSHVHRTVGKLGAEDRVQAVLIASRRGWI